MSLGSVRTTMLHGNSNPFLTVDVDAALRQRRIARAEHQVVLDVFVTLVRRVHRGCGEPHRRTKHATPSPSCSVHVITMSGTTQSLLGCGFVRTLARGVLEGPWLPDEPAPTWWT